MFHLKLLINFLSLLIAGQIDWHAFREEFAGWTSPTLKPSGSPALLRQADPSGLLCARRIDMFLRRHSDMFCFVFFLFQMSKQEKVVFENSPTESNQSSAKTKSDDDLSDVSVSESELGDEKNL